MTKEKAEAARAAAIERVKDAQAKLGKVISQVERSRAKAELEIRLQELKQAKDNLRAINLAAMGARPIEPPTTPEPLTTEKLAQQIIEAFDELLRREPGHPVIRTLRAHFDAERPAPPPQPIRLPPRPLRQRGKLPQFSSYLDAQQRRAAGPGARLYRGERG